MNIKLSFDLGDYLPEEELQNVIVAGLAQMFLNIQGKESNYRLEISLIEKPIIHPGNILHTPQLKKGMIIRTTDTTLVNKQWVELLDVIDMGEDEEAYSLTWRSWNTTENPRSSIVDDSAEWELHD